MEHYVANTMGTVCVNSCRGQPFLREGLAENRVSSERIRQLVLGNDPRVNQGASSGYLGQAKVVLPDLGQFDRLRAAVTAGGSE